MYIYIYIYSAEAVRELRSGAGAGISPLTFSKVLNKLILFRLDTMVLTFDNVCNRQGTSRPVDHLSTYSH